ncbi:hypothetical protein MA16_Dca010941 [Dendrobium catenatum]|uniref:Uncharacterized protein n=1 Tax=Dendrobium catenatum TaxID=906689 RepID=A0A2I0WVP2_9ASPA|nr:hypothetical protein MA16_Dca010941 [Dendrobium catenatum]
MNKKAQAFWFPSASRFFERENKRVSAFQFPSRMKPRSFGSVYPHEKRRSERQEL